MEDIILFDYNETDVNEEIKEMEKDYRRCKHLLLMHGAYQHPSYRFATETVTADSLRSLLLRAHQMSNRLSTELYDNDLRRLRLQVIVTLQMEDEAVANELQCFFDHELNAALQETLELFEGCKTERIIGCNPNLPAKYALTVTARYAIEHIPA